MGVLRAGEDNNQKKAAKFTENRDELNMKSKCNQI
ncbi:hypothetical protein SPLC1_S270390 [Arthrospira platensis C1]|nr:hypothetical protein SPLC1_S270390 [Arthrospira platensis C1]